MFSSRPFTFDRVVRLVLSAILLGLAVYLIYYLRDVLLPFGVACLVAYILEPFVQFNRRLLRLKGRVIAVFVTLFEAIFFLTAFIYFLAPTVIAEANKMGAFFEQYASAKAAIPFLPDSFHEFLRRHVDFREISSLLTRQEWTTVIENALSASWSVITGSITVIMEIFSWCIVLLYIIFIMLDYDRLSHSFSLIIPPPYRKTFNKIGHDIKTSMNHYFRGQALVAACVGVLFTIGFLIIGLPMAVVMGFFIFILTMVPYLQLVSIPFVALLCLVSAVGTGTGFWTIFGECILVYCIVQVINDLFLTPKILGHAMGLNPAIILLSLSVWGSLLGLLGLIIALPMTTLCISYYEQYIIDASPESAADRKKDVDAINDAMEL